MAIRIKHSLARQISKHLNISCAPTSIKTVKSKNESGMLGLCWPVKDLDVSDKIKDLSEELKCNEGIERIEVTNSRKFQYVNFFVDSDHYVSTTIQESLTPTITQDNPKNLIIEYSSPNMAKPFHMGHLRSTIIGNFLSNINKYMKNNVTRVNYLGDWGTQCGLLNLGVGLCRFTEEQLRNKPIELLYLAYVKANKIATSNNDISIKARQIFNAMENGDPQLTKDWNTYKEYTKTELTEIYNRLGMEFDVYDWESMYNSKVIDHIMNDLESKGIVKTQDDGRKVVMINNEEVILKKSDGSSLYLSRDLAAAHDRFTRYNFDKMLYVVDNSQAKHFKNLINIFKQMDSPIANNCIHVKFGRIKGMSTRKGNVTFLKDVLDEAQDRMQTIRLTSSNTKGDLSNPKISDILATSGIIIHDLKHRREKDYTFSWDVALQTTGDTGSKIQYAHCRLNSIEKNCNQNLPSECNPKFLQDPEALDLISRLGIFGDVLKEAHDEMEPYYLVTYLFGLCSAANKAANALRIKGREEEVAQQRLLLFHATRRVLKTSMEILGLQVLDEM